MEVSDDGEEYMNLKWNGIKENQLKDAFATSQYNVLDCCRNTKLDLMNHSSTPCLLIKLRGVKAVQTLFSIKSNNAGKVDTFVLNFRILPKRLEGISAFMKLQSLNPIDPNLLQTMPRKKSESIIFTTLMMLRELSLFINLQ